jgi:hypothetical protein
LKIGGFTKSPDYSFRVGPERKFFVETKKPSVNIKQDIAPAFQLRRYGWSAKLALSILTDFEEFAVYDCRVRPVKTDGPSTARVMYLTFDQYEERWDEIAAVFSRDAVLKGSFDRYAESNKKKRGTAEVDAAFLDEIDGWRLVLARNLALRNRDLSQRDLNFAVQKTIDRLIFLRICEDRGMETYGRLQVLPNGPNIYRRLCELFREADHRYNSGLFHFAAEKDRRELPDEWTLGLTVDDAVLREIIRKLYYPDSPYEFSVIGADILGQVYEQFLGKVIRLTAGHQAKVEEKPEVRKAGGVYYTPTYIVQYIVQNTVGTLLQGKTAHEVAARTPTWKPAKGGRPLSVLDPACGSGSFLIGAYQYLLDWYRDWFVADDPKRHKARVYQTKKGQWRLSTAERKRILLDHIYGVDIDSQAVEVTKLSLLLKVLEGETKETLQRQLFAKQRALPDLADNIKCGNSLIGPDFYRGKQLDLFDDEERMRINVFDWQTEFREIMQSGGFDAVIGNPPYVRQEELTDSKTYFQAVYKTFQGTADLYVLFIEKGLSLLRDHGSFGMIVSNKWLRAGYGQSIRRFLAQEASVNEIIDLAGLPVFQDATVRTLILLCSPIPGKSTGIRYAAPLPLVEFKRATTLGTFSSSVSSRCVDIPRTQLTPKSWSLATRATVKLIHKMQAEGLRLAEYVGRKPYFGVKTGLNAAFIIDADTRAKLITEDASSAEIIKPVIGGQDIRRYRLDFKNKYLLFTRRGIDISRFPAVRDYLSAFREDLTPKRLPSDKKGRKPGSYAWYEIQDTVDYYQEFEQPKVIFPDIATSCRFAFDNAGIYGTNTTYIIPGENMLLLAILNSKIAQFYFSQVCAGLEGSSGVYLRFFGSYLEDFPVAEYDDRTNTRTHRRHDLVTLTRQAIKLQEQLQHQRTSHGQTLVKRQIAATDHEIDQLVYELYGLTDDEIRIVEEATAGDAAG